jgi:hypothetical protein
MRGEKRGAALLALAGGVMAIAWSAIFVRWAKIPGISSAFYRTAMASVVLWPLVILFRRGRGGLTARTFWVTSLGRSSAGSSGRLGNDGGGRRAIRGGTAVSVRCL